MRAVSLLPPVASLLAHRRIVLLGMCNPVYYRGRLALHQCDQWSGFPLRAYKDSDRLVAAAVAGIGYGHRDEVPRGAVVGVASVVGCYPTESLPFEPSALERDVFDTGLVRWWWLFRDGKPLPEPLRTRGYQNAWEVADERLPPEFRFRHSFRDNALGSFENPEFPYEP